MGQTISKVIMDVGFRTDFDLCEELGLEKGEHYAILSNYGLSNPMHPFVMFIIRGKHYYAALLTVSKQSGMARHNLIQLSGQQKKVIESSPIEWVIYS